MVKLNCYKIYFISEKSVKTFFNKKDTGLVHHVIRIGFFLYFTFYRFYVSEKQF